MLICAVFGVLAVALGAFGSHQLRPFLTPVQVSSWDTGIQYHFVHLLAMLVIALVPGSGENRYLKLAFRFFTWGIILFSGSLYFLAVKSHLGIGDIGPLGLITPLGGLALMVGWGLLAFSSNKQRR